MTTTVRAALAALITTACLLLTACGGDGNHNDADVSYAQGMLMHHQQAIEMSDIVLAKQGLDPKVEALAERIKKAQGPEIETMKTWLKNWDEPEMPADHGGGHGGGHGGMDGMVSGEEIAKLKAADGASAGKLYLEQMIKHHEGAVEMAQQHLKDGKNPEALALSKQVVADQTKEIAEMRTMLG